MLFIKDSSPVESRNINQTRFRTVGRRLPVGGSANTGKNRRSLFCWVCVGIHLRAAMAVDPVGPGFLHKCFGQVEKARLSVQEVIESVSICLGEKTLLLTFEGPV